MTEELANKIASVEEMVQNIEEKYRGIRFVAIGKIVMRGQEAWARARSHTFAKRIAHALNSYTPNDKGV